MRGLAQAETHPPQGRRGRPGRAGLPGRGGGEKPPCWSASVGRRGRHALPHRGRPAGCSQREDPRPRRHLPALPPCSGHYSLSLSITLWALFFFFFNAFLFSPFSFFSFPVAPCAHWPSAGLPSAQRRHRPGAGEHVRARAESGPGVAAAARRRLHVSGLSGPRVPQDYNLFSSSCHLRGTARGN